MSAVQETHDLNKRGHGVRSPMDGKTVIGIGTSLCTREAVCVSPFVQTVRSLVEMREKHGRA